MWFGRGLPTRSRSSGRKRRRQFRRILSIHLDKSVEDEDDSSREEEEKEERKTDGKFWESVREFGRAMAQRHRMDVGRDGGGGCADWLGSVLGAGAGV